jgi:hypothetical protein
MKISITEYGETYTWESEKEGHNINEVATHLKGLLVSAGYHPKSVDECFSEDECEWFPTEKVVVKTGNKVVVREDELYTDR